MNPQTSSAQIYFADQSLNMNILGELRATPYSNKMLADRISCEELQNEEALRNKLRTKLEYCRDNADTLAQNVEKYINEDLVLRARVLYYLQALSHFTKNAPGWTKNKSLALQKILFDSPTPEGFINEQQQSGMDSIIPAYMDLHNWAKKAYDKGFRVKLDKFISTQVKAWLELEGLQDLILTGKTDVEFRQGYVSQGNSFGVGQLCSGTNTKTLAEKIRKSATTKLENLDELIGEARKSLQGDTLNAANTATKKEFSASIVKDQDIAILLALALNDPSLKILFFHGVDAASQCHEFGSLDAHGLHVSSTNTLYLPSKDVPEQKNVTLGDALKYTPVGDFGVIKDFSYENYPAIKAHSIWIEEFIHHSMKILFNNRAVPFNSQPMSEEMRLALIRDIKAKPTGMVAQKLGGYADGGVTNYVRLLENRDANFLLVASREAIAEVAYYANEHGLKAASLEAPAITKYLQERILPLARTKCTEMGIDIAESSTNPTNRVNPNTQFRTFNI